MVNGPVSWFRSKVVEPARGESYPWYHRQFQRVPGIEECLTEDVVCRLVVFIFGFLLVWLN